MFDDDDDDDDDDEQTWNGYTLCMVVTFGPDEGNWARMPTSQSPFLRHQMQQLNLYCIMVACCVHLFAY